jgi:hypothetical protein
VGPEEVPAEPVANSEKRRRTRSLPQDGQLNAVSTVLVIGRRSSNDRSQLMHTYS